MMYYTSSLPQSQNQTSFLPSESSYIPYTPTSISQNVLLTTSYASTTSSLGVGGQNIFSWAHTVPTYMPWAPKHEQGSSEGLPSVVRFMAPALSGPSDPCTSQTATTWELIHNLGNTCSGNHTANQHLKRRSDIDSDEEPSTRPVKQYISEERMAAKLSQMHISADGRTQYTKKCCNDSYKSSSKKAAPNAWNSLSEDVSEESEAEDTTPGSLVLSPELKKIIQPNPDLVKALLHERFRLTPCYSAKPSMALVLWQPPGGTIKDKIESHLQAPSSKLCEPDNTNNNNNNNSGGRSNLNGSTVPSFLTSMPSTMNGPSSVNSTKDFRLPVQSGVPFNSVPQCLDETDDMEL